MLQLHNRSPFRSEILGLPDQHGVETLAVVIKATFRIGFEAGAELQVAAKQQALTIADEYWGEPGASSLRYPSEVHPGKPGTDVIVVGDACAPDEQPVRTLDVAVQVAGRRKVARVYGDRVWVEGVAGIEPSRPAPFVRMPVIWERSYGGREPSKPGMDTFVAETRNPVGVGFVGTRSRGQFIGQPAPNVDDPSRPLTKLGQAPAPVGFGALAATWPPRVEYAGTYDQRWIKTRAPYLPTDFDSRFFNTAPGELNFAQNLQGGEAVAIAGFHSRGTVAFNLPRCRFDIVVVIAGEQERPTPVLETVLVEPTDERFTMTWRAVVPVDKRMLQVDYVNVDLAELSGAAEVGVVQS